MSVKDLQNDEDSFFKAEQRKEIIVESKGKKLKFYANPLSWLDSINIGIQAGKKNGLAMLVAASITDEDGNKFTYDEILRLKKEISQPFFDAVTELNAKGKSEKKD